MFEFIPKVREKILEGDIQFQNESIKAKDLMDDEHLQRVLGQRDLTSMMLGQFKIGHDISHNYGFDKFYIERKFILLTGDKQSVSSVLNETDLLKDKFKIIIISDIPGMGKSTLLSSLIIKQKKIKSSVWCIRINLNESLTALEVFKRKLG